MAYINGKKVLNITLCEEQGVKIDESKIIEKSVSGKGYVIADDVSEIPHPLTVKLTSDSITDFSGITLSRSGRNLILYPYVDSSMELNGITFTDKKDGYVNLGGTAATNTNYVFADISNLKKGTYTFSIRFNGIVSAGTVSFYVRDKGNNTSLALLKVSAQTSSPVYTTFTTNEDLGDIRIYALFSVGATVDGDFAPQLEYGDSVSNYERFSKCTTLKVNADGTVNGVNAIAPTTVLSADDETVNISMTYQKSWGMDYDWNRFWDTYQNYGNRTDYNYAFYGLNWNDTTFNPKYKMKPTSAQGMFDGCKLLTKPLTSDIVDFSQCTNFYQTFRLCAFDLGVIDTRSNNQVYSYTFSNMACERIEKIILPDMVNNPNIKFNASTFQNMSNLTHIRFEGVIANFGAQFGGSKKLDKESIINIVTAHSVEAGGMTAMFSKTAVNSAFETTEGLADGSSSEEWLNLIATRPNVTFTLV